MSHKLEYEQISYRQLDYNDLENFIAQHYGIKEYSIPCVMECGNDTSFTIRAQAGELDQYDNKVLEMVKAGREPPFSLSVVLQDLCNKGLVDEGSYLVKVSW